MEDALDNAKSLLAETDTRFGITEASGERYYALIRKQQRENIIETGVYSGVFSVYLLAALDANNREKLYSIGLPDVERNKSVGWAVPDSLRDR